MSDGDLAAFRAEYFSPQTTDEIRAMRLDPEYVRMRLRGVEPDRRAEVEATARAELVALRLEARQQVGRLRWTLNGLGDMGPYLVLVAIMLGGFGLVVGGVLWLAGTLLERHLSTPVWWITVVISTLVGASVGLLVLAGHRPNPKGRVLLVAFAGPPILLTIAAVLSLGHS